MVTRANTHVAVTVLNASKPWLTPSSREAYVPPLFTDGDTGTQNGTPLLSVLSGM